MQSFGGTPICPRCSKAVYLAEQAMGPGRKLYHKPCLACTMCNKRLDSFTLLEHDQQPYCKSCHLKSFGTRDLRHANLPYAQPPVEDAGTPSSPTSPSKSAFPPQALLRPLSTGNAGPSYSSPLPRLKPNRSLVTSPISSSFPRGPSPTSPAYQSGSGSSSNTPPDSRTETPSTTEVSIAEEEAEVHDSLMTDNNNDAESISDKYTDKDEEDEESRDVFPEPTSSPYPSNIGRPGIGTIPRTVPLYLNGSGGNTRTPYKHGTSHSISSLPSNSSPSSSIPSNQSKEAEDISNSNADEPIFNEFSNPGNGGTPLGRSNTTSGVYSSRSPGTRTFGNIIPLTQTATGTRYGIALSGVGGNTPIGAVGVGVQMTGSGAGSPRKWGGGTPTCPRCMKSVYFAEQVKAVGKTFHKNCLRCVECNSSLDSTRLRDHDGDPFCVRCYGKLYGPQGGGYALLGKAGG